MADALIKNENPMLLHMIEERVLEKARVLGYTDDTRARRRIFTLEKLWRGGIEDKCFVLELLSDQMSAKNIQVEALHELFSKVSEADLGQAIVSNYQKAEPHLDLRIPIGDSGLTKVYFENEKGQLEIALVYIDKDAPKGTFKQYRLVGTMAEVRDVACLDLHFENYEDGITLKTLQNELEFWNIQNSAQVRNIPTLYYEGEKSLYCENFAGGDLVRFIFKPECTTAMREALFQKAGLALLEYLEDIQKLGLVHRDIKPENLLVSKDGQKVAVTDFGLMAKKGADTKVVGTEKYLAPEQLQKEALPDPRSDLYSAALTLAAIRYRTSPDRAGIVAMKARGTGVKNPKLDSFDELLQRMLAPTPEKRPSVARVLSAWQALL
jgi:serine/threonine protein kinase